jgi:transcriptional regulator with XRE-family HTH domain
VVERAIHDVRQLKLIETLRTTRRRMNLTQAALAAKLGKRQQFVSKYESGERRLDFFEVLDVASALGLSSEKLIDEVNSDGVDAVD